jgi:hypothetical protein
MEHVSKVDTSISSTTTNGSNKVIREIDDDEEMEQLSEEEPNHKPENNRPLVPSWAQGHALERQLEKQHRLDPTHIFGPIKPIKLKGKKKR